MKNSTGLLAAFLGALWILFLPPLFIWMGWQRVAVETFHLPALGYLQCFWLNLGVKNLLGHATIINNRKDNSDA